MSESSKFTKTEYEVLSEFRYTLRRFLRFSENAAEELGITPQQHQVLLDIMGFPSREKITIGELAERLQIQHHSAVGLVDRLAAENLIERTPALDDRRQVYVTVTSHGRSVLKRLSKAHRKELGLLAPQLRLLLERIIQLSGNRK
jgi:DNA-binding MarR family transcriptional regulator